MRRLNLTGRKTRRLGSSILVLGALALAAPSSAFASRIEAGPNYELEAGPGEVNRVRISATPLPGFETNLTISDAAGIADPVPPICGRLAPTTVQCAGPFYTLLVDLRDEADSFSLGPGGVSGPASAPLILVESGSGDDRIDLRSDRFNEIELHVSSGAGKDVVFAGPLDDRIGGGPGRDRLLGLGGSDSLYGGGGTDRLAGGSGTDNCHTGRGRDQLISCERRFRN